MTPRSLRIATEPAGPGRGTWWWVRIYDTPAELRDAAHRHHPWNGPRATWDRVDGCCQAAPYRERIADGTWQQILPRNKQLGVIRLTRTRLTIEVCAHETLHAALATYRMLVRRDVRLGTSVGPREEDLCYIAGELLDQLLGAI